MRKGMIALCALLAASALVFASGANEQSKPSTIDVTFWTAPNQGQFNFWDAKIQEFNAAGVQLDGKTIKVTAQMMPETPSSEAGIQNALATNTAPVVSENINRGFAATLAQSGRVYDLQDEQFFKDIIAARHMENIISGWQIDGKQYVIPIFANPMGYHWNSKALRALGFSDRVPQTLDDIKLLVKNFRALKDTKMKEIGVTHTFQRSQLLRPDLWWERWFDFEMQYDAFSQGKPMVVSGKLVMDPSITKDVLEFIGLFGDTMQTAEDNTAFEKEVVPAVFQISAPWDVPKYEAAGKVYGIDGDYVFGPAIVKQQGDVPYTFADSKGLVFYKGGNVTEEQHRAAVTFISWVWGKENNAQTVLDWYKTTGMLPVRGDTMDNPVLAQYIGQKQVLQDEAEMVKNSIPAMADAHISEILTAMGEGGLSQYVSDSTKNTSLVPLDATTYVQGMMEAMKTAGSLQ